VIKIKKYNKNIQNKKIVIKKIMTKFDVNIKWRGKKIEEKINKKNNNQESEEKIGYKKTNETIPLYFGKEMRKKRKMRKKKKLIEV
jgi:hypothetical protein